MDIHEWNIKNVYGGRPTREKAKKRIFAWLYNLESNDYLSERTYNREEILEKYWDGTKITNPFGRTIECDRFHAISYLVQSTAVDIVLRQMIKLHDLLKDKKSYIAFTIHDSVVIDMAEEDMSLLPELKRQFSTFRDTQFLTNVSIGSDFGNMESEE
jgi:DNA polymerase I-like protein with 3'-5' exonuclease and polymerase domains